MREKIKKIKKAKPKPDPLTKTSPLLVAEWHPTKNGDLKPDQFSSGSEKRVWWKCDEEHEWQAKIQVRGLGIRCPKCRKAGRF